MAATVGAPSNIIGLTSALAAVTTRLGASQLSVSQTDHGLAVGNPVRHNGTSYVKAQANGVAQAEVLGVVSAVADADNFIVTLPGNVVAGLSGLTAGSVGFLSSVTAGEVLETDAPDGTVSKPVWVALTSTTALIVASRGIYKVSGTSPATDIYNEPVGVGTVDGTETVFTLAQTPAANSLRLTMNGVLRRVDVDYTLSGVTVTFTVPPPVDSLILASYEID